MNLDSKIEQLTSVGKTASRRLKNLGIITIEDLIFYFPNRYEDFSQIKKIAELKPEETVTLDVKIELIANRRSWRSHKTITEALVSDETGSLKIVWFNQPFLTKSLTVGDQVFLSGRVTQDNYGCQLISPSYEKLSRQKNSYNTGRLVPVYPLTEGLTQKQLRFLLSQVLGLIKSQSEFLPAEFLAREKLLALNQALEQIHFPTNLSLAEQAKKRLQFDELFLIQLQIQKYRQELSSTPAVKIAFLEKPTKEFVASLPFTLTADQKKSAWEIIQDLERGQPMNRLLEGDVGSGKTVVVALVAVNVIQNGYKVALMAPTEILASQHYQTFLKLFQKQPYKIGILTRTRREINGLKFTKANFQKEIEAGKIDILLGTQALIQASVKMKDLGLVVIDEQHRFGVNQRKTLLAKGQKVVPHFLSLTATPIPRSLALSLYGDLDLSLIKNLPGGRKPIISKLVAPDSRLSAYDFIRNEIKAGRQAFVICPLVEESEQLDLKSAVAEFKRLQSEVFPDLKLGLLHGRLKAEEKNSVMQAFANNELQILVSTSVVEVGIDVPNATIMMIEGAERFGLAQLHQFRGRVGRGEHQSYCFLLTDNYNPKIQERLRYFVNCRDGFALAEKDLQLRGAGEIYGTRQSGLPDLKIADLTDLVLISKVQTLAREFLAKYSLADYPELQQRLAKCQISFHFE